MDCFKKWALTPFAAIAVIGLVPLMKTILDEWALIPAGVFASISLGSGLDYFLHAVAGELNEVIMSTVVLGGMGLNKFRHI